MRGGRMSLFSILSPRGRRSAVKPCRRGGRTMQDAHGRTTVKLGLTLVRGATGLRAAINNGVANSPPSSTPTSIGSTVRRLRRRVTTRHPRTRHVHTQALPRQQHSLRRTLRVRPGRPRLLYQGRVARTSSNSRPLAPPTRPPAPQTRSPAPPTRLPAPPTRPPAAPTRPPPALTRLPQPPTRPPTPPIRRRAAGLSCALNSSTCQPCSIPPQARLSYPMSP
ncbi:hypothetical protein OH77DRAFT_617472 [Trametes cingulata]|nr:hypothetical protein OH77DRAFT_617472 [Trametes cingulata]